MRKALAGAGLADRVTVDSAGTGAWHVGELPDPRTRAAAARRGIELTHHGRQFRRDDFTRFELILAMDVANHRAVLALAPDVAARAKVRLLRSFDPTAPEGAEVPDPYYGEGDGFERVLDICAAACEGLLAELRIRLSEPTDGFGARLRADAHASGGGAAGERLNAADDRALDAALVAITGAAPRRLERVHGGDINQAWRAELADGRTVFVKHNANPPAGMFAAEARGLAWLAAAAALRVPAVVGHGDHVLVLEWMAPGPAGHDTAAELGRGLAALHRAGAPCFGFDGASFIATLPQDNTPAAAWGELWFERRLRPMVERAIELDRGPARWRRAVDELAARAAALAPDEPPARLHGDLWSGNVLVCDGASVIVDPAVYGGPREVDLAMLALFGGLDERTVAAYDEAFALAPGWDERVPLWQLYPLLVHVVLFGGSYAAAVERAFVACL